MKETALIDYATPLMNLGRMGKEVHDKGLQPTVAGAEGEAVELVAEARILVQTLRLMQNK